MNKSTTPNLDDVIMTKFKVNILKSKVLPCISKDIDVVINNRRTWETIGTISDYLENLFIALSFVFLIIDIKIIIIVNMSLIACCKYSDNLSQRKQSQLTEKLNEYLKSIGIKESVIDTNNEDETKI